MHRLPTRWLAALLVMSGACADETEPRTTDDDDITALDGGDESPDDEGDEDEDGEDEEDDGAPAATDAGGRKPDAGSPAGNDAGRSDGGRGRGDAGGARADAATPSTDAGSSTGGDAGPVASGNDVPAGDHCAPFAAWDAKSAEFEQEVLRLTNEARAVGHNCDTKGMLGPTTPLTMNPQLRCSARVHSTYMAEVGQMDHDIPAGSTVSKRIGEAGYKGTTWGENIAAGQRTPAEVVNAWLESDGHCSNIMNPGFKEIGVAYKVGKAIGGRSGQSAYWTQNFGAPSRQR